MAVMNPKSENRQDDSKRKFEKYFFPVILILLACILGVLLERFILGESHELSYCINESAPVNVNNTQYFPTAVNIANTGNTPLENIILSLTFGDKIVSVRSQPPFSRRGVLLPECDTDTILNSMMMTFDLAKGENHNVTIVAEGPLVKEHFFIKSQQVMGKEVQMGETRQQSYVLIMVAFGIVFGTTLAFIVIFLERGMLQGLRNSLNDVFKAIHTVDKAVEQKMKELRQVRLKLGEKEKQIGDLQKKLEGYERQKGNGR